MSRAFEKGSRELDVVRRWWTSLQSDRGARAELRRCRRPLDVMLVPAFHALRGQLVAAGFGDRDASSPRLALLAGLLSHLKETRDRSPAAAFSDGDPPPVSPLRFRQVLDARDDDELYLRLRRLLPLVEGRLNLDQFAHDTFHWNDAVRKRWVYDYRWPQKVTA